MAIIRHKENDHIQYGTISFTADTFIDIANLPTNAVPGSECFCIENSITYILNSQGEWKEKQQGSGGGGSGGGGGGSSYPSADGRSFPLSNDNVTFTTKSQYYNDIAKAVQEKLENDTKLAPGEMAAAIESIPSGSTPPFIPEVTTDLICDNSALTDTLTFTEDYEDYDFLKFELVNPSYNNRQTDIWTTPEVINNIRQYSSNKVNFNEFANNQYKCYTVTSNLSWAHYASRNLVVKFVYGVKITNAIVQKTVIYNREAISGTVINDITSDVPYISYDYIFFATCTGDSTETQPCINLVRLDNYKLFNQTYTMLSTNYYNGSDNLQIYEYEMDNFNGGFYILGVKIIPKEES